MIKSIKVLYEEKNKVMKPYFLVSIETKEIPKFKKTIDEFCIRTKSTYNVNTQVLVELMVYETKTLNQLLILNNEWINFNFISKIGTQNNLKNIFLKFNPKEEKVNSEITAYGEKEKSNAKELKKNERIEKQKEEIKILQDEKSSIEKSIKNNINLVQKLNEVLEIDIKINNLDLKQIHLSDDLIEQIKEGFKNKKIPFYQQQIFIDTIVETKSNNSKAARHLFILPFCQSLVEFIELHKHLLLLFDKDVKKYNNFRNSLKFISEKNIEVYIKEIKELTKDYEKEYMDLEKQLKKIYSKILEEFEQEDFKKDFIIKQRNLLKQENGGN